MLMISKHTVLHILLLLKYINEHYFVVFASTNKNQTPQIAK